MRVLLDTNFFLLPCQFGVDVFGEIERVVESKYKLITISPVVRELRGLARERGKEGRAARVGLELLKKKDIKVIDAKKQDADDAIVKLSDEGVIVATLDKELRDRLRKKGRKTIYLRGKQKLVLG